MTLSINGRIPSGSIDVVDARRADDVQLRLRRDPGPDALAIGYYHFRASGVRGQACRFRILDVRTDAGDRLAGREDYEDGWTGTGPHVSYDRRTWWRIPGRIEGPDYVFEHTPEADVCWYARWAPYTAEREMDFVAACQGSPRLRISTIGHSVEGRDLDLLTIGEAAPGRKVCWVIARQHPSETMGGYFIEGLVRRLLDEHDPAVHALLRRAVFHIVPNMNPDGAIAGHTRANAAGANLNREWVEPSLQRSPEVFHVRALMAQTGVDFCMDCHGDEELRCNFLGGPLEIPSKSARLDGLFTGFERAWSAVSPDYEMGHPYPGGAPATADLRMAWNWIAERFDCLSVLLEQPFKDTSWRQDPRTGWSPDRATRFGESLPAALNQIVAGLR
jgi:murein tripeptide amidase MpaA